MFLLYDQASQRLKAFGWATLANIKSPFWEHPLAQHLQVVTCFSETSKIVYIFTLVLGLTYRTGDDFASCRVMGAFSLSNHTIRDLLFDRLFFPVF